MSDTDDTPAEQPLEEREISNAAEPSGVRAQAKRAKERAEQAQEFWAVALRSVAGRVALWEFFELCRTFTDSFPCTGVGFPNDHETWFRLGQRSLGQQLYQTLLMLDLEGVRLMHVEHDTRFKVK